MAKKKGKGPGRSEPARAVRTFRQGHDPEWARAKKLCRLSAEDVRMAKEMGLNQKPRLRLAEATAGRR